MAAVYLLSKFQHFLKACRSSLDFWKFSFCFLKCELNQLSVVDISGTGELLARHFVRYDRRGS